MNPNYLRRNTAILLLIQFLLVSVPFFVLGAALIISGLEQFGGPNAPFFALVNVIAYTAWTFWLLAVAVVLMLPRPVRAALPAEG